MSESIKKVVCRFCKYEWFPRSPEPPKVCTRCKRHDWQKRD